MATREFPQPRRINVTTNWLSRKSATIFGQGTIPEPSTSHIDKGMALVALAAAFVYIYARIPQIAEMTLSFYATGVARTKADLLILGL